jgi:hypothetical protein
MSVGPIVQGKKYYIGSRRRGIFCIQQIEGRITLVTSCLGTAFRNKLLKERKKEIRIEVTGR